MLSSMFNMMGKRVRYMLIVLLAVFKVYDTTISTLECPQKQTCCISRRSAICRKITDVTFPALHGNISKLFIIQCNITNFTREYFRNLTHLTIQKLYLFENNIDHFDKSGFEVFHQLQFLSIRQKKCRSFEQNMLAHAMFGLNSSTIQAISITHMRDWKRSLHTGLFAGIKESSIKCVRIAYTKISSFESSMLPNPSGLKIVLLDCNNLRNINLTGLFNIHKLDISGNQLTNITFCSYNLDTLTELNYRDNVLNTFRRPIKCLKNLQKLDMSKNTFRFIHGNVISQLSNLKSLSMSMVGASLRGIYRLAFNSSSLEMLKLTQFQGFKVNDVSFSSEVFWFTPNLKVLHMTWMVMKNCSPKFLRKLFFKLTKLQELRLEQLMLKKMPKWFLSYFPNLKTFSISGNNVISWVDQDIFHNVSSLRKLNISKNQISVVKSILPLKVWNSVEKLDLSQNIFSCSCENLWFIKWIKNNQQKLFHFNEEGYYKCNSPLDVFGKPLANFHITKNDCKPLNILYLITIILCSFALVILIVFSVLYRYRWHIKYFIYMLRSNRINCPVTYDQRKYDGFVVYSDDDRNWVHDVLLQKLEKEENFALCIHFRDFEVGRFIIDNIVEKMSMSKKVLLVLSNNFIKSEWCHLELKLAQKRSLLEGSEFLIIIRLEELKKQVNLSILRAIVNSTTYADWHVHSKDNILFWNQVIRALGRSTTQRSKAPENCSSEDETKPLLESGYCGHVYSSIQKS